MPALCPLEAAAAEPTRSRRGQAPRRLLPSILRSIAGCRASSGPTLPRRFGWDPRSRDVWRFRGRPDCQHCNFRLAVDPYGHVNSPETSAHEHGGVVPDADTGDDGELLRGDGTDEWKHHLSAVCVSRE